MKPRQIVLYLVLFLIFGLFYYLYEVRIGEKEADLAAVQTKIYDLKNDQVRAVRLHNDSGDFHLVKEGADGWKMLQPMDTPADKWAVLGLIEQVLTGTKDRVFDEPVQDLAEFGLDSPKISITFEGEQGALAPTLYIGDKNPAGFLYYARLGDSKEVFTVVAPFRQDVNKTLFELRDRSLMLFPGEDVDGLKIVGRETIEIAKKGLRQWELVGPDAGPADNDEIEKLLHQGLKGPVQELVAPGGPADRYGFDQPRVVVQALSKGRMAAEVTVGAAEKPEAAGQETALQPRYWARTSERPEVLLISSNLAGLLDRTVFDLKDRHVLTLDRRRLTAIGITAETKRLAAQKVQGVWDVTEPAEPTSQDRHISALLMSLEDLRFTRKLDNTPETVKLYGLDRPDLTIRLTSEDGGTVDLSAVLKPVEDTLLAVRSGEGPVLLVDKKNLLDSLPQEVRGQDRTDKKSD